MKSSVGSIFVSSSEFTFRQPKIIRWTPAEDITAYELALAMPILFMVGSSSGFYGYAEDGVAALPENVRRHFTVV
jgi:hypothetical protein